MTELYLNDTQVVFDNSESVKITKENPYFTQSGTYTLDVSIPMNCPENRLFFSNLQRLDVSKSGMKKMDARLIADNHLLLSGSATINSVTDETIKVQLVGDNSDVNFISSAEEVYIDEIDMGTTERKLVWNDWDGTAPGDVSQYVFMPVYDETNSRVNNAASVRVLEGGSATLTLSDLAPMPNLLTVLKKVIGYFGYAVTVNELDVSPWNRIVIANARKCSSLRLALPHWTVKEFLQEIQYFFNCTVIFNSYTKQAEIRSNKDYFTSMQPVAYESVDEYTAEVDEDGGDSGECLANANIRFDASGSPAHEYDIVDDELLDSYPHEEHESSAELDKSVLVGGSSPLLRRVYDCGDGVFIYGGRNEYNYCSLRQINQFGSLIRDKESDEFIDMRICPVAVTTEHTASAKYYNGSEYVSFEGPVQMPTLECTAPYEKYIIHADGSVTQADDDYYIDPIWDALTAEGESTESEMEDRIQVMFIDEKKQYIGNPEDTDTACLCPYPMGFTDHIDKAVSLENMGFTNTHSPWSLALKATSAQCYLGQLHANNYTVDTRTEYQIDFEADDIPDVSRIFIFGNKRFVCKKLEMQIGSLGRDRIIKGYFHEML